MQTTTHILHRQIRGTLPVAIGGDGPYLIDSEGKRYLDASGGAAVSCLGHSHPRVIAAIKNQVERLAFAHSSFFTSEPAESLADFLVERAPPAIEHVYFVSGGSEAIEAALKITRQYFLEKGEPRRYKFISRRQSYHGNTLGALSVGGNMWRRKPFQPLLMASYHISPCYPYRDRKPEETLQQYGLRVADELEARIQTEGPETVIAFVAEPIVGASAGVLIAAPGYWPRIREICDKYGVLLILDEVMCGMGRTGTWFACEHENTRPDVVAIAKGLGAGYQPIGAMLCSNDIYDSISEGSGFFQHGHTYMGHSTACAAALAVQSVIEDENLLHNVRARGAELGEELRRRFAEHPYIGDIRGRGLFWGLELVADRESKQPLDPALNIHERIKQHAMSLGLLCYPGAGTIDGERGNHILLAPPFIITSEQVEEIGEKLAKAIDQAFLAVAAQL